jgi:hypothetical protein
MSMQGKSRKIETSQKGRMARPGGDHRSWGQIEASCISPLIGFTVFCTMAKKTPNKGDNVEKVTKSIRIDPKLWHRARVKALAEGKAIQDLVAELLRKYLGEDERTRAKGRGE